MRRKHNLQKYKICIDAGHGGKDPGAVNKNLKEKDFTLQIALEVINKLNNDEFFRPIPTRIEDESLSLGNRCKIANTQNCDLFVSIHLNAADNKAAKGIETLVYNGALNRITGLIFQNELIRATDALDRGVKSSPNIYVLKNTEMKAVLLELGFISNDEESKKFLAASYRSKIADAIISGIYKSFYIEPIEEVVIDTRYNTIDEIPEYAQPTIKKYINSGYIDGVDKSHSLDLSDDMLRVLTIMDRAMNDALAHKAC